MTLPLFVMTVALVLLLVLTFLMRLTFKGARFVRPGRVTGIIGRKGHGKSLFLVHEMLRAVGRRQVCDICTRREGERVTHRVTVASNCELELPEHLAPFYAFVDSWDDLYHLPHMTLCVIDEIGMAKWAPADATARLPKRAVWFLAQCRKLGVEFVWCAQREDRVTAGLRAQTDEVGFVQRGYFRSMSVRFVEPEDVQKLRNRMRGFKPLWVYRYRVTRRLAAAYNTFQMVAPPDGPDSLLAGLDGGGPSLGGAGGLPSSSMDRVTSPVPGSTFATVESQGPVSEHDASTHQS